MFGDTYFIYLYTSLFTLNMHYVPENCFVLRHMLTKYYYSKTSNDILIKINNHSLNLKISRICIIIFGIQWKKIKTEKMILFLSFSLFMYRKNIIKTRNFDLAKNKIKKWIKTFTMKTKIRFVSAKFSLPWKRRPTWGISHCHNNKEPLRRFQPAIPFYLVKLVF